MDYKAASILQGYLQKQSPNILKNYRKRYFAYRNKGQFLIWFKKKPNSIQDQPRGFIKSEQIDSVEPQPNEQRIFHIQYHDRLFILRAENRETRDIWVNSLHSIMEYHRRLRKSMPKKAEVIKREEKGKIWRWQQANEEDTKLIRLQNEKLILAEGQGSVQQNCKKFLKEVLGCESNFDVEKNMIYGYFNHKNFITTDTRWYFLCCQYNLFQEEDEDVNERFSAFVESEINQNMIVSNKKSDPKKKKEESSDSQDLQRLQQKQTNSIKINTIYEFDIKTKKVIQKLPLLDIVNWTENTKDPPYSLTITYASIITECEKDQLQFVEPQKQLVLFSNYITQIQKWMLALKVAFRRYSLSAKRDKIIEQMFVRYKIKMFRVTEGEEWRVIGSQAKPEYVYLNMDHIKVGGHTFKLEDTSDTFKSQKIKMPKLTEGAKEKQEEDNEKEKDKDKEKEKEKEKEVQQAACSVWINKEKLTIIFSSAQDERAFRKRAKKFLKKLQSYLQDKKAREIKRQVQQVDLSTYYLDKRIRQTSGSIKINFYQVLQQDNSNAKKEREKKQKSFLDKFLSIFCGTPIEEDLYF